MKYPLTKILFFSILGLSIVQTQSYDSWRMGLVANPQYPYTSDVWGYTDENGHDFAVFGVFNGTVILDVSTNPSNPIETGYIPGAASIWRDLKTHGDYLYVTNESGNGLDIIDLTDPWHPFLAGQYAQTFTTAHNLFIADGYAYIVGANTGSGGIRILNLTDPVSPVEVGSWETNYIHDIYVKNDTAYASGISTDTLYILDVLDKTSISTLAVIPDIPNSHSNWVSNDSKYLFSASETQGGHIIIFDIQDFSNINVLAHFEIGNDKTVHNVFIKDDRMFLSYYIFGTRVVDISDPSNPVEVAYFDNYPGSDGFYDGNWGTYPFTNSGLIYSTSMSGHGFFILQYPMYVEFIHEPLTDTEDAEGPYDVSVTINPIEGNVLVDGTAMAVFGLNGVFTDTTFLTAGTGAGEYEASLPGHEEEAGVFSYYFSVLDTAGRWSTKPFGAPESYFSFHVGPDLIPPVIHEVTELGNQFGFTNVTKVKAIVTDNIAVGEVTLKFTISVDPPETIYSIPMAADGDGWTGEISWEGVPWHTVITYQVIAVDSTSMLNETVSEIMSFEIVNRTAIGSWETEDLSTWNTGDGWGITSLFPDVGLVMNDSPGETYQNNANNILARIDPLDLSPYSSAYLSFWNYCILEPDSDFGLVELSTDGIEWTTVSSITGIRVEREEVINLTPYIAESGLWLRFRMTSDENKTYVGWFLDDLYLMVDTTIDVSTEESPDIVPEVFSLEQNYPNPFNPITTIRFDLPKAGNVELVIYDILGREVKTLVSSRHVAGQHKVVWNASDVASGIYFYRLEVRQDGPEPSGSYTETKKLIVLK